jgi:hypothetical protein
MKRYMGDRTIDGVKVTVDGKDLDPRMNLARYSEGDFEWSYEGPEPRQLAFAMLFEHTQNSNAAKQLVETFMTSVVANFDNEWEVTSDDMDHIIDTLTRRAGANQSRS